jgi:iron-sulfur cluster repair protein YtfE (RIC family)
VGKDTGDGLREAIARAVTEHGALAVRLRTIRELRLAMEASLETPPECDEVLDAVARLEAHVHECMFLENCILFPRALGA